MACDANDSGFGDFDFLRGDWLVRYRRLVAGSQHWDDFNGTMTSRPVLGSQANIDDNNLDMPSGQPRAAALWAFDPATRLWSIWWLSAQAPTTLGVLMLCCFQGGVGTFYCDEIVGAHAVRTRFMDLHGHRSTDMGATLFHRWRRDLGKPAGTWSSDVHTKQDACSIRRQ